MSSEPVRTYVATEATSIYQDKEQTQIAEGGTAMLPRKATFSGQRVENNMVWISPGVGFVPARLVLPCNQYEAPSVIYVRTEPRDGAPIAEGGNGQLARGSIFDAGVYSGEWLWLTSDLGYIRVSEATLKGVSSVTYPSGSTPPPAPDYWTYTVQPGDSLSTISERFYQTQAFADAIFRANRDVIPNPDYITVGLNLKIPKQP